MSGTRTYWKIDEMSDKDFTELQKHINNMMVYETELKGKYNDKKRLDEKHRSNE